tara:strand:- start:149 stop:346 length:198 start_codon:yes stop_codon:yes gene_type:complete
MPTVIIGLLAIAFGLWGLTVWWWSVVEVLRGVIPIVLLLVGMVALAAGVTQVRQEDVKDEDILEE